MNHKFLYKLVAFVDERAEIIRFMAVLMLVAVASPTIKGSHVTEYVISKPGMLPHRPAIARVVFQSCL